MLSTVHSANDIRIVEKEALTLALANQAILLIAKPPLAEKVKNRIQYAPLDLPHMPRWKRPWVAGYAALKMIRAQAPSIIHFHDPELIPVALLLKRSGFKVVYDVHEDTPADILSKNWIPRRLRPVVSYAMHVLERYAARRFDALVVATPTIATRFVDYGLSPVVIKNYAKTEEFHALANRQTRIHQAVYVGRITFDRGLREMSDACKAIGIPLILAGTAEPEVAQWIAEQSHIEWRGLLSRDAIVSLLQESFIGLCVLYPEPNYLHALPIKLFEYMAASLPVIVSDLPSQRDIVTETDCGMVIPSGDVQALTHALRHLIDNPLKASAMGQKGRDAVFETFNWECEGKKLITLYEKLLNIRTK